AWCWWWMRPRPTPSPPPCARKAKPSTRWVPSKPRPKAAHRPSWPDPGGSAPQRLLAVPRGFGRGPIRQTIHAAPLRQRPQPGDLPLGQLAGGGDRLADGLVERDPAIQMVPELPIAHATDGRQARMQVGARMQGTDFIQQPGADHGPVT